MTKDEINLIDEFKETFVDIYDANPIFIEAAGYWLASATLGVFTQMPDLKRKTQRPNIYVIFSSIPWAERRSTIVILAEEVYKRAWNIFLERVDAEERAFDSIIRKGTEQGIADRVMEKSLNHYAIIEPEMGGHWSAMKRVKHLEGFKSFLTSRFDGHEYIEDLSQRNKKKDNEDRRYIKGGTFFSLIGDLQEPQHYFDEFDLSQGILRRTDLIFVPREEIDPERTKSEYDSDANTESGIEKIAKMFADRMEYLRPLTDIYMNPKCENYVLQKEIEIKRTLKEAISDVPFLYKPIEIEMLKKLPVLRTAASNRTFDSGDLNERRILLSMESFKTAKEFIDRTMRTYKMAINKIMLKSRNAPITSEEMTKMKIVNDVKRNGDWASKITMITGIGRIKLNPFLETLYEEERLFGMVVRTGEPRAKAQYYYTTTLKTYKKHEKEFIEKGYEVSSLC